MAIGHRARVRASQIVCRHESNRSAREVGDMWWCVRCGRTWELGLRENGAFEPFVRRDLHFGQEPDWGCGC